MATLADLARVTGIRVVTRTEWGARPPKARHTIALPTPRLWIHHTGDDRQGESIRDHQDYHMDTKGWNDLAYSLMVDDDGTLYEGRGIGVAGGHTAGDNTTSHAICLFGNFEARTPTVLAQDTVVTVARYGRDAGWWIPTLGGHRDAPGANTACPGRHLYALLPTLRARTAAATQEDDFDMRTDDQIKDLFRRVLNEGTGKGQTTWADTSKAVLGGVQTLYNQTNRVLAAVGRVDDDVIAGLSVELAPILAAELRARLNVTVDEALVVEALKRALREGTVD